MTAASQEDAMSDFESFMAERIAAAAAYVRGDGAPVCDLSTTHDPATFFGPDGKLVKGAEAVVEAYRHGAQAFGPKGESRLEILQQASDGKIAYWPACSMPSSRWTASRRR
jgi:ketosteroid isomerase-like protein